jgi:excisionase family DNA binding protein
MSGRSIPHNELSAELHGAGEHAKRFIDHVIKAACLLLEDHQAGDQAETSARIITEIAPAPLLSDKRELSVKELAARWGVSERSIYQWRLTGGLPFKKRGRLLRFDPIKVDQWEKGRQELFTRARLRVVR